MALFPLGILSAAGAGGVQGDYELIETNILGSNQASIVFSNLGTYSSTYKHLQIRFTARSTLADTAESLSVRVNGVSTSSYSQHRLFGTGSSVISSAESSITLFRMGFISSATATANSFGAGVIDILDPYSTTKNKTFRSLGGVVLGAVALSSGAFLSTAAVSSITITSETGANFVTGSRFSIYGIRG